MNKFWKKIAVLALAGTMTLGMSVNALAETPNKNPASQYTNSGNSVESDINYINLIKDYDRAIGTQTDSNSPAENFIFTIEPYAVWNAGTVDGTQNGQAYTISNMPLLGRNIPEKVYVDDILLSLKEKRVLVLYLNGLSYSQIAEELGDNTKAVDNAISRTKKKLEELLKP